MDGGATSILLRRAARRDWVDADGCSEAPALWVVIGILAELAETAIIVRDKTTVAARANEKVVLPERSRRMLGGEG